MFFQNDRIDILSILVNFEILFLIIVYMQSMWSYPEFEKNQKSHFLKSRPRLSDFLWRLNLLFFFIFFKKKVDIFDHFFFIF